MSVKIKFKDGYGTSEIREYDTLEDAAKACDPYYSLYSAEDWLENMEYNLDEGEELPTPEGLFVYTTGDNEYWASSEQEALEEIIEKNDAEITNELSPEECADIFITYLQGLGFNPQLNFSNKSSSCYLLIDYFPSGEETDGTFQIGFRTHSAASQLDVNQLVECPCTEDELRSYHLPRFKERWDLFVSLTK